MRPVGRQHSGYSAMASRTSDILQAFPARTLRPDERELVAEWLASADDIASAYISERRSGDPAIYRKIVIAERGNNRATYLIHTPFDMDFWIVQCGQPESTVHRFGSLRDALNFVRPV